MAILDKAALVAKLVDTIYPNNNKEILAEKHQELLQDIIDSLLSKIDDVAIIGLGNYNPAFPYVAGMATVYGGQIYQANTDATGTFNPDAWTLIYPTPQPSTQNIYYIPEGETIIIPINKQAQTVGDLTVDGTLDVRGQLIIINGNLIINDGNVINEENIIYYNFSE